MMKDDEELRVLLRAWLPHPISSSEIRRAVWQRISRDRSVDHGRWIGSVVGWLSHPAVAAALIAIAIGVGAAVGTAATAQAQTESFLQAMTPFRP